MKKITVLAGLIISVAAHSAEYPVRPIRLVVPYPPGGATDIIARAVAQKLTEKFGHQVVTDNRGGGGQLIGTDLVAKATANGYTLLLPSVTHSINPGLRAALPYDSVRDFAAVTLVARGANVLVVHPSVTSASVGELVKLLKSNPDKYNYASSGNGSGGHLAAELFKSMAGVRMTHVPYKGGGPAYVDLVAGQVSLMFTSPVPTLPHVRAGRLRALATTGARRSSAMPDLPTIAESGYPGYEASLWYGILAPNGTPARIINTLNRAIVEAVNQQDVKERFGGLGVEVVGSTPDYFSQFISAEMRKWSRVIKEAQIRVD